MTPPWNPYIALYLFLGLSVGTVSGALGIGGGVLLVPALYYFFLSVDNPTEMDALAAQRASRGTALLALSLPVLLPATWQYFNKGWMRIPEALVLALGLVVGSTIGGKIGTAPWLPKEVLRIAFGLLLIYLGMRYTLSTDNEVKDFTSALIAVAFGFVTFWVLKIVGRPYHRKSISEELNKLKKNPVPEEPDYQI